MPLVLLVSLIPAYRNPHHAKEPQGAGSEYCPDELLFVTLLITKTTKKVPSQLGNAKELSSNPDSVQRG